MARSQRTFEVVVADLTADAAAVRDAAGLLSVAERLRAGRFAFERDRRRFILARARLRQLLGVRLGVRPEAVELAYGRNAKPLLGPRFAGSELHFNLSHCDDVAVYAFASGYEVGIDVEAIRLHADADTLVTRFFSPVEIASYRALEAQQRPLGFVNCWTRKEAVVKALGDGLSMPLQDFDVTLAPGEPAQVLRMKRERGTHSRWSLSSFSPAPSFVAALALSLG